MQAGFRTSRTLNHKVVARVSKWTGVRRCTIAGADSDRHKFKIGQLVNYFGRERASSVYQITQLLPPEGEAFQYRIKNVNEPHERIAKEYQLRGA